MPPQYALSWKWMSDLWLCLQSSDCHRRVVTPPDSGYSKLNSDRSGGLEGTVGTTSLQRSASHELRDFFFCRANVQYTKADPNDMQSLVLLFPVSRHPAHSESVKEFKVFPWVPIALMFPPLKGGQRLFLIVVFRYLRKGYWSCWSCEDRPRSENALLIWTRLALTSHTKSQVTIANFLVSSAITTHSSCYGPGDWDAHHFLWWCIRSRPVRDV